MVILSCNGCWAVGKEALSVLSIIIVHCCILNFVTFTNRMLYGGFNVHSHCWQKITFNNDAKNRMCNLWLISCASSSNKCLNYNSSYWNFDIILCWWSSSFQSLSLSLSCQCYTILIIIKIAWRGQTINLHQDIQQVVIAASRIDQMLHQLSMVPINQKPTSLKVTKSEVH